MHQWRHMAVLKTMSMTENFSQIPIRIFWLVTAFNIYWQLQRVSVLPFPLTYICKTWSKNTWHLSKRFWFDNRMGSNSTLAIFFLRFTFFLGQVQLADWAPDKGAVPGTTDNVRPWVFWNIDAMILSFTLPFHESCFYGADKRKFFLYKICNENFNLNLDTKISYYINWSWTV